MRAKGHHHADAQHTCKGEADWGLERRGCCDACGVAEAGDVDVGVAARWGGGDEEDTPVVGEHEESDGPRLELLFKRAAVFRIVNDGAKASRSEAKVVSELSSNCATVGEGPGLGDGHYTSVAVEAGAGDGPLIDGVGLVDVHDEEFSAGPQLLYQREKVGSGAPRWGSAVAQSDYRKRPAVLRDEVDQTDSPSV